MLYITYANFEESIGVRKKIAAQCRVFKEAFGRAYYAVYNGQMAYLLQDGQVAEKRYAFSSKRYHEILLNWLEQLAIRHVYIRYRVSDLWVVEFLKELKERNIRRVLEFPTYPYDGEGWRSRPAEDDYYREQMRQYVDCCTTYARYETVFGIPCIPLVNGVDMRDVKKKEKKKKETIELLAVATMRREHGYERIIHGLRLYNQSGGERNICFHLAGDGVQIHYYNELVDAFDLRKQVVFHGILEGQRLDELYERSDIGVGALGIYKSGIHAGVGIKAAEYCAKGLPMIMVDDYGFENQDYILKVPNDDSPICMEHVTAFYDDLQEQDYPSDMYDYVTENYTWSKVLEPVIKYLNKEP